MKVTLEKEQENVVKLDITIPAKDAVDAYNNAVRRISQYVNIDGFRKGKAPRAVVERHVGTERIKQEARRRELSPQFDEFAAKFKGTFHRPLVFGHWLALHDRGVAPLASDVPKDNELDISQFLKWFSNQRKPEPKNHSPAENRVSPKPRFVSPAQPENARKQANGRVASSGELIKSLLSKIRAGKSPDNANENPAMAALVA